MKWTVPIVLAMLLSGCAEFGARAITNATYLAESGEAYVRERHDIRREIRRRCELMLWQEVDSLVAEGRFEDARTILAVNYPGLVTFDLVDAYQDGRLADFDTPWGCTVDPLPPREPLPTVSGPVELQ